MNMMNPTILYIETATDVCSVALSKGTEIIGLNEEAGGNNHAKHLLPFVDEVLKQAEVSMKEINGGLHRERHRLHRRHSRDGHQHARKHCARRQNVMGRILIGTATNHPDDRCPPHGSLHHPL